MARPADRHAARGIEVTAVRRPESVNWLKTYLYKIWLYLIEYADKIPTAAYLRRVCTTTAAKSRL